jgi:hypothetical protein
VAASVKARQAEPLGPDYPVEPPHSARLWVVSPWGGIRFVTASLGGFSGPLAGHPGETVVTYHVATGKTVVDRRGRVIERTFEEVVIGVDAFFDLADAVAAAARRGNPWAP